MKTLFLDIETSPNIVYTFDLWNAFIGPEKIIEPSKTISWAAKWLGDKEMMFDSIHESSFKSMLKGVYGLLEEADVVVHYNGTKFDIPCLNRDFLSVGLEPPKPIEEVDLLKVVRKRFKFPSNKLSYVVEALGIGEKVSHEGIDLWIRCLDGDDEAWDKMEEYNRHDVTLLEGLYEVLKGWIKKHPNYNLHSGTVAPCCPNCGSGNVDKRGFRYTRTRAYQRYRCDDCGAWSSSNLSERREDKSLLA